MKPTDFKAMTKALVLADECICTKSQFHPKCPAHT